MRLWRLTANLQVDDLPENQKLVWPTFPQRHEVKHAPLLILLVPVTVAVAHRFKHALSRSANLMFCLILPLQVAAATSAARSAQNASERLENPPVNPITGPGRTAAMVRADAMAYQKSSLANAQRSGGPAGIFQGNYLLIRLPADTGVKLHRVAHCIFYQDATAQDATFTSLEYTHVPVLGQPDLWGTFTPRPNPNYNPTNVRSGLKFVRHSTLSRSHIVMYNVKTLERRGELRIAASALKELATICPEYPFPASILVTHRQPGAAASSRAASTGQSSLQQQPSQQQPSQQQPSQQQPSHSSQQQRTAMQQQSTKDAPRARLGAGLSRSAGSTGRQRVQQQLQDQDSSDEEQQRKRQQAANSSDEGDDTYQDETQAGSKADTEAEDDPPPPVPAGMAIVDWSGTREEVDEFLLWTTVDASSPAWHHGKVRRALKGKRRDGYTHDARLDDSSAVRGVTLSEGGCVDGLWMPIATTSAQTDA
eukprot:1646963-Pleurochrysis_carterae.AAC.1